MTGSIREQLAALPAELRNAIIDKLPPAAVANLNTTWRGFNARPEQLRPGTPGSAGTRTDWRYWLLQAGRGAGKTRTGAETVREWEQEGRRLIHLIAPTAKDVRDVMVEGPGGLLSCYPEDQRPYYEPSKGRVTWASGAIAKTFSSEEPERLRGPQCEVVWCIARGSLIKTELGDVPIERVRVGDLVWTRSGLRRVLRSGMSSPEAGVFKVTCGDKVLRVTGNHKLHVNGTFRRCDSVVPGDKITAWNNSEMGLRRGLSGKVSGGIETSSDIIRTEPGRYCMSLFGREPIRPQFQKVSTCTMSTKIRLEMKSTISNAFLTGSMSDCTILKTQGDLLPSPAKSAAVLPKNSGRRGNPSLSSVPIVESNIGLLECEPSSALPPAVQSLVVRTVEPDGVEAVYDLTVEGEHEFFANGLLVHNCDEIAAWKRGPDTFDNMAFGLRLGNDPRAVLTSTPKPVKLFLQVVQDPNTVITRGSTYENRSNLAPGFFSDIIRKYEGTRLGRQELLAELLEDIPGALWTRAIIDANRVNEREIVWDLIWRIVVAIDPAVTAGEDSDETGIIVAGLTRSGHVIVLDDLTCRESPLGWARIAVAAFRTHRADRVIGEVNNGGDLVAANLRSVAPEIPFRAVRASRGKAIRAEPVAALYEQGRVHHVRYTKREETYITDRFDLLEDQLCSFVPGITEKSPDRMDALVWAITELVIDPDIEYTGQFSEPVQISPI